MSTTDAGQTAIIRQQQVHIAHLEERLKEYKRALRPEIRFPRHWRLAAGDAAILRVLMTRTFASDAALLLAIHGDTPWVERSDPSAILKVRISKTRRNLKDAGLSVTIHRERHQGYFMTSEDRKTLRKLVWEG